MPFIRTVAGKSISAAIKNSMFTMRNNRVSFAERLGSFSFAGVLDMGTWQF